MLQDLLVPCHQGTANGAASKEGALENDRVRLAVVVVGVGECLLCLGLWPGAAQNTQSLAGTRAPHFFTGKQQG